MGLPRDAKVYVQIHQTGSDDEASGVDDVRVFENIIAGSRKDFLIHDKQIARFVPIVFGIDDSAVFDPSCVGHRFARLRRQRNQEITASAEPPLQR